jgi:small-conductance mechanosensitive channel
MVGDDVLLTIAQVAVAFAGFSSVVAVFGQRAVGRWSEEDLIRLIFLIASSLVVMFLAFLPFFLRLLRFSDAAAWGISSAFLAASTIVISIAAWRRVLGLSSEQPGFLGATVVNSLLRGAAFILQTLNFVGPFDLEAGPYVVGTGLLLLTAVVPFCGLLYYGIDRDR